MKAVKLIPKKEITFQDGTGSNPANLKSGCGPKVLTPEHFAQLGGDLWHKLMKTPEHNQKQIAAQQLLSKFEVKLDPELIPRKVMVHQFYANSELNRLQRRKHLMEILSQIQKEQSEQKSRVEIGQTTVKYQPKLN